MTARIAVLVSLLALMGCGLPADVVVLIPDENSNIGKVAVHQGASTTELDRPLAAVISVTDDAQIDIGHSLCRSDRGREIVARARVELRRRALKIEDVDKRLPRCGCERGGELAVHVGSRSGKDIMKRRFRSRIARS